MPSNSWVLRLTDCALATIRNREGPIATAVKNHRAVLVDWLILLRGYFDQRQLAAATDCLFSTRRLFVTDQFTKHRFLVDSGSDLCCFPKRILRDRRPGMDFQLNAANNSLIKTYSFLGINLNSGLRRLLQILFNHHWPFHSLARGLPLKGHIKGSVCTGLINAWDSLFGCPDVLTADKGGQFKSRLISCCHP